ncbi:hypothetical protein GCM10027051_01080 [Niabella terrae]
MKVFRISGSLLLVASLLFSCKIQQNLPQYLEKANEENIDKTVTIPELIIQKNDLLAIQVYSDFIPPDANPDDLYNQPTPDGGAMTNNSANMLGNTTNPSQGYLVDNNGNIEYPRLGLIKAEGLTKLQLQEEIKKRLISPIELLKNPTVIVRFQSYKVTAVGEFNAPQTFNIPTEKINIFQAVSMAGGITQWGQKDKVKVIREHNGKRELGLVDLSSPDVFTSPFYFLKQNDIILVDPIPEKAKVFDENTTRSRVGLITSFVSVATALTGLIIVLTQNN